MAHRFPAYQESVSGPVVETFRRVHQDTECYDDDGVASEAYTGPLGGRSYIRTMVYAFYREASLQLSELHEQQTGQFRGSSSSSASSSSKQAAARSSSGFDFDLDPQLVMEHPKTGINMNNAAWATAVPLYSSEPEKITAKELVLVTNVMAKLRVTSDVSKRVDSAGMYRSQMTTEDVEALKLHRNLFDLSLECVEKRLLPLGLEGIQPASLEKYMETDRWGLLRGAGGGGGDRQADAMDIGLLKEEIANAVAAAQQAGVVVPEDNGGAATVGTELDSTENAAPADKNKEGRSSEPDESRQEIKPSKQKTQQNQGDATDDSFATAKHKKSHDAAANDSDEAAGRDEVAGADEAFDSTGETAEDSVTSSSEHDKQNKKPSPASATVVSARKGRNPEREMDEAELQQMKLLGPNEQAGGSSSSRSPRQGSKKSPDSAVSPSPNERRLSKGSGEKTKSKNLGQELRQAELLQKKSSKEGASKRPSKVENEVVHAAHASTQGRNNIKSRSNSKDRDDSPDEDFPRVGDAACCHVDGGNKDGSSLLNGPASFFNSITSLFSSKRTSKSPDEEEDASSRNLPDDVDSEVEDKNDDYASPERSSSERPSRPSERKGKLSPAEERSKTGLVAENLPPDEGSRGASSPSRPAKAGRTPPKNVKADKNEVSDSGKASDTPESAARPGGKKKQRSPGDIAKEQLVLDSPSDKRPAAEAAESKTAPGPQTDGDNPETQAVNKVFEKVLASLPPEQREDRDALAQAIQNLLLEGDVTDALTILAKQIAARQEAHPQPKEQKISSLLDYVPAQHLIPFLYSMIHVAGYHSNLSVDRELYARVATLSDTLFSLLEKRAESCLKAGPSSPAATSGKGSSSSSSSTALAVVVVDGGGAPRPLPGDKSLWFDPQKLHEHGFTKLHVSNFCNLLWGLAKVNMLHRFPYLVQLAVNAVMESMPVLKAHNLASLMWAFAASGVYDEALFYAITGRAAEIADTFTPQLLQTILWGCAAANFVPEDEANHFVEKMIRRVHIVLDYFYCCDLPNLGWSLAKLDADCLRDLFPTYHAKVYEIYSLDDCAAVALAFAKAGLLLQQGLWRKISEASLNLMSLSEGGGRTVKQANEVAIVVYAFAHANVLDRTLFNTACKRAIEQKIRFDAIAGVRMLYALAKVHATHLPFLKYILPIIKQALELAPDHQAATRDSPQPLRTNELCKLTYACCGLGISRLNHLLYRVLMKRVGSVAWNHLGFLIQSCHGLGILTDALAAQFVPLCLKHRRQMTATMRGRAVDSLYTCSALYFNEDWKFFHKLHLQDVEETFLPHILSRRKGPILNYAEPGTTATTASAFPASHSSDSDSHADDARSCAQSSWVISSPATTGSPDLSGLAVELEHQTSKAGDDGTTTAAAAKNVGEEEKSSSKKTTVSKSKMISAAAADEQEGSKSNDPAGKKNTTSSANASSEFLLASCGTTPTSKTDLLSTSTKEANIQTPDVAPLAADEGEATGNKSKPETVNIESPALAGGNFNSQEPADVTVRTDSSSVEEGGAKEDAAVLHPPETQADVASASKEQQAAGGDTNIKAGDVAGVAGSAGAEGLPGVLDNKKEESKTKTWFRGKAKKTVTADGEIRSRQDSAYGQKDEINLGRVGTDYLFELLEFELPSPVWLRRAFSKMSQEEHPDRETIVIEAAPQARESSWHLLQHAPKVIDSMDPHRTAENPELDATYALWLRLGEAAQGAFRDAGGMRITILFTYSPSLAVVQRLFNFREKYSRFLECEVCLSCV
ncbi:unnamed protein product [Amoebophrya sp. A120]|nr:unnamed protein product [Amoebophrya sp. A120]|eukprot:GSA120T00018541001.1